MDYNSMKYPALQRLCSKRGLQAIGKKSKLVALLKAQDSELVQSCQEAQGLLDGMPVPSDDRRLYDPETNTILHLQDGGVVQEALKEAKLPETATIQNNVDAGRFDLIGDDGQVIASRYYGKAEAAIRKARKHRALVQKCQALGIEFIST